MDIFISWSGERSRAIAEAIREWLPKIMPSVKPWMSQTDINKGSRWNPDIAQNLDTSKAGIFCLTPSNLTSESILFEAGAISKSVSESRVYTLLAGVEVANLRWPLAQFQATSLFKDDFKKMLCDINKDLIRLEESSSPEDVLEEAFDLWWPKLEAKFAALPPDAATAVSERTQKEILEEILELVRSQARLTSRQDEFAMIQEKIQHEFANRLAQERVEHDRLFSFQRESDLRERTRRIAEKKARGLANLKSEVCAALERKGHLAAANLLRESRWSRVHGALLASTALSSRKVNEAINQEAALIISGVLQNLGQSGHLNFLCICLAGSGRDQLQSFGRGKKEQLLEERGCGPELLAASL